MSRGAPPGPGHNAGPPLEPGSRWRRYAWARARKDLLGQRVPIEIVRIRVRRARELGLSYPHYASILMGSGRDIVGFLFTVEGLQLRLRRRLEMPDAVREKLPRLTDTELMAFAPSGEGAEPFRVELSEVAGARFAAAAPEPGPDAGWRAGRDAVRAALDPLKLPGNAVVMIGARADEARWAEAANMARFLPSSEYFGQAGLSG